MMGFGPAVAPHPPTQGVDSTVARFVSPHRNFSLGVRGASPAHLGPDGRMVPAVSELSADFGVDGLTGEDFALAQSSFTFRGLPIYENGQTVNPNYRVSVFISEVAKLKNGWSDEDEALVVETLRHNGPIGQMYVEVVPVPTDKPWNGYDELSDETRIVELALAIGADLTQVVQYEKENSNRQSVIEALEAALAGADETIIVSA